MIVSPPYNNLKDCPKAANADRVIMSIPDVRKNNDGTIEFLTLFSMSGRRKIIPVITDDISICSNVLGKKSGLSTIAAVKNLQFHGSWKMFTPNGGSGI